MNLNYHLKTLKNGIRIAHMPINGNISYCGFIVNAGTRDEKPEQYGMAHFVEHMLFKGTQKRKSRHIIERMEVVGGEINAFTNKEETVIYSVFPELYFERALELMSDICFNSGFPQKEIVKERDVILDEINYYEDNPSDLIYDEFENMIFQGSQLGHPILGTEETLINFDTGMLKDFTGKLYVPSNMVFFSIGKTDWKKIKRLAEKYLSEKEPATSAPERKAPGEVTVFTEKENKETSQSHVMIGSRSYSQHDPKRRVLYLLNNILGGPGMNSRLNISVREKKGYVYNIESSITSYSDTGLFSIYFGTDKQNTEKCLQLIKKELRKLRTDKLTGLQLDRAKRQLIGQISISNDNNETLALAFGKSILRYNRFDSMEETVNKINTISPEDILFVANEIFTENCLSFLTFG